MVLAPTARHWLAPLQPPPPPPTTQRQGDPADDVLRESNGAAAKRRRKWPTPIPVKDQENCCQKINCKKLFEDDTSYLGRALVAEQALISKYVKRKDRRKFVADRVPIIPLEHGKGSMLAGGKPVCRRFFQTSFGISNNVVDAAKGTLRAPPSAKTWDCRRKTDDGKKESILSWLDYFSETYGEAMPHKTAVVIYATTKEDLYEDYCKEIHRVNPDRPEERASKTYFNLVWRKHRPQIKVRVGGEFMKCDLCIRLKETLHGSPGVKPTSDSVSITKATEELTLHRKMIQADRQVIADSTSAAMRAKADGKPLDYISLSVDAANQTTHVLPKVYPPTHGGQRGYAERQKIQCALIEGQCVEVFFTPQNLGAGCNLACTAVHLALTRLIDAHHNPDGDRGCIIKHAHWQVDNAASENKNNFFLGYAGILVAEDIADVIEVHFMMVGHTHIKIDQVFSRFAVGVKGKNIFTRSQQAAEFRASYQELPVHCLTLRNLGNFKGLLNGRVNRVPNITTFRAFRVEKRGGRVQVTFKKYMHEKVWSGRCADGSLDPEAPPHILFIGPAPQIRSTPPYQLHAVTGDVLRKVRQRYEASHERLPAAFPEDKVAQEAAKAEMEDSVTRLGETGERAFDLPVHWLPSEDGEREPDLGGGAPTDDSSSTDSSESPDSSSSDSDSDSTDDDELGGGRRGQRTMRSTTGRCSKRADTAVDNEGCSDTDSTDDEPDDGGERGRRTRGGTGGRRRTRDDLAVVEEGCFAFFVATGAPFVVGKVLAKRVIDGRESGVDLHWLRPCRDKILHEAASMSVDEYGKFSFAESYVVHETTGGRGGRRKPKREKESSWEPVSRIVATCTRLIGGGKKIPAAVLATLREATNAKGGGGGASK